MKSRLKNALVKATLLIGLGAISTLGADNSAITGRITNANNEAVPGATVMLVSSDSIVAGTIADNDGEFSVSVSRFSRAILRVSAVGYQSWEKDVSWGSVTQHMAIELIQVDVELDAISVLPDDHGSEGKDEYATQEVASRSRESLVPSNPMAAIRSPQVMRRGSQHSSNLRMFGVSPAFYLNGSAIGYDPNHYGAFSIIPGAIVDGITAYTQGTSAKFGLPSAIEVTTVQPYDTGLSGELNLAVTASDASLAIGNRSAFIAGSARKSVIDRLAKEINTKSDRQMIPPTNFRDLFVTGGVRLSQTSTFIVDAYQARDFLSLESEFATGESGGVSSYLHTSEWYSGCRFESVGTSWMVRSSAAVRKSFETYRANNVHYDALGLRLNLTERSSQATGSVEFTHSTGNTDISFGMQGDYIHSRTTDLYQRNWNFQPPDAASDVIPSYQRELNTQFGDVHVEGSHGNGGAFVTAAHHGSYDMEHGVRIDYFGNLAQQTAVSSRHHISFTAFSEIRTRLYVGTFAESPANRILETRQALVREFESQLTPIRSTLVSASLEKNGVTISGHYKVSRNLPDLAAIPGGPDTTTPINRLVMTSSGTSRFAGVDLSLSRDRFLSRNISFLGYYGYGRAYQSFGGIRSPHELDVPHRAFMSVDVRKSATWTFGLSADIHSGIPYTSQSQMQSSNSDNVESSLRAERAIRNSLRFPTQVVFNARIQKSFGHGLWYVSMSNVTNKKNAIISSHSGYIYDAGFLPSIGVTYRW